MKRLELGLALLMLWAEPAPARPDLIFQVPEVLVRHAAVPRPVGTGPSPNTTRGNSSALEDILERTDYYVEHEISTADAKEAAKMIQLSEVAETLPGCGKCSRWEMEYCESNVLADHCCCERRYIREPFPWLPHTCYIGPERCTPLAQNCARYTRIRDCCCKRKMAEKWKDILSNAESVRVSGIAVLLFSLVLFSMYL